MSADSWFVLVGAAFAFWFFVLRRKPSASSDNDLSPYEGPPPVENTWFEGAASGGASRGSKETLEQFEIRRAVEERKKLQEHARKAEAEAREASKAAKDKIERANKIVKETGLSEDLGDLWEAVEHWPSWSTLPSDWEAPLGFSDIHGAEVENSEEVCWRWEGASYQLRYVKRTSFLPDYEINPREIHLSVNGQEVAALSYNQRYDDYGSSHSYMGVDALTVGPWITDIVRMTEQLRAEDKRSYEETLAEMDEETASRIKL